MAEDGEVSSDKKGNKKPRPDWLLLVYMAAEAPNLQEPLRLDLKELARPLKEMGKRSRKRLAVSVQIRTATGVCKRFRLSGRKRAWVRVKKGDCQLSRFVNEEVHEFEPGNTALIVWGHGTGIGRGIENPSPPPLITMAVGAKGEVDDDDLLKIDKPVDIIGFDECYMASIEIAYALHPKFHYMLAPQASIGLSGWHYDQFVDHILNKRRIKPKKLGLRAVRQVGLSYSSPEALSLLDLTQAAGFKDPMSDLVEAVRGAYDDKNRPFRMRQQIYEAFEGTAWAGIRQFLDLADLCRNLASRVPDPKIRKAALRLLRLLTRPRRLVVDQLSTLETPLGGVSIYCPWFRATRRMTRIGARNVQVDEDLYKSLPFADQTGWGCLVFSKPAIADTERYWVRKEIEDRIADYSDEHGGWGLPEYGPYDPTPAGRGDGPKPPKRDDPKPPRRDDPKPPRRDDPKPPRKDDPWGL